MKIIKYFVEFLIVIILFFLFFLLRPKLSSYISGKLFEIVGPFFRSKKIIHKNLQRVFPDIKIERLDKLTSLMWNNYGRIFAEYIFIKNFRFGKINSNIEIDGQEILDEIKEEKKQVIFISGHLSNFELMAMHIAKSGINLCTIYRPLNNFFLNPIMEKIRSKYICKYQIKKGIGGLKKLINLKNKNFSTALMIDQRVSEGIHAKFFNDSALTTTIPSQLIKKFNIPVVPVSIERIEGIKFKIKIMKPIFFSNTENEKVITENLNKILEKMILKRPEQWIWSHNRWK